MSKTEAIANANDSADTTNVSGEASGAAIAQAKPRRKRTKTASAATSPETSTTTATSLAGQSSGDDSSAGSDSTASAATDFTVSSMMGKAINEQSTIAEIEQAYKDYLVLERGVSTNTYVSYCYDLKFFLESLQKHAVSLIHFQEEDIRNYLKEKTNEGLGVNTLSRYFSALRAYVKFLQAEDLRSDNPLKTIERPKLHHHLPTVMSEESVSLFLNAPNIETGVGLRDKAMFELLYACGLRVSELCNLRFESLHLQDRYLVISGKGGKQRIIPMTKASIYWLRRYVYERRQEKDPQQLSPYVFLSQKTGPNGPMQMSRIGFWHRVKVYARQIGMAKEPSPHTFRHAFATHLLNHDADLRSLQMLLGHTSINTTQIYTHVALARMHKVYDKAHPQA